MKKIVSTTLALCCLGGVLAVENAAATIKLGDQIEVKGQMRVRYWNKKNVRYQGATNGDQDYFDNRFRAWVHITLPEEKISAHLRFDLNDAFWGSDNYGTSRWNKTIDPPVGKNADHDDTIEVNRAYLQITQSWYQIIGGLNFWKLGEKFSYENSGTGISIESQDLPVHLMVGYLLEDEGGSKSDVGEFADSKQYIAQIDKKINGQTVKAFLALAEDGKEGHEPQMFGVSASGKAGIFKYKAEFDYLGGELKDQYDYKGVQFWANAEAWLTEQFKLGGDVIYAQGSDDPANEKQISFVQDARASAWAFQIRGPFYTMDMPLGGGGELDPLKQSTGSIGGGIYAQYKVLENLSLFAQGVYLTAETNNAGSQTFENATVLSCAMQYHITNHADFAVGYSNSKMETSDDSRDEPRQDFVAMIRVKF